MTAYIPGFVPSAADQYYNEIIAKLQARIDQLARSSGTTPEPQAAWYEDSTGCFHMSLDVALIEGNARDNEHEIHYLYGEPVEPQAVARPLPLHTSAHQYAMEYEFRADEGAYTPTDGERAMIEDAINGFLGEHDIAQSSSIDDTAKAAERERLRFEGDLDRWMKAIGAGITGYQPEAYAVMDAACVELINLRAHCERMRAALEKIASAPAWGAPESWETTPAEVRQLARDALSQKMGENT